MIKKFITTVILGIVAYTGVFGLPMMVAAQTDSNLANAQDPAALLLDQSSLSCNVFWDSNVMGCVAQFLYYIVYVPSNWIAGLTGILLDFGLGFTLDSDSYQNTEGSFVTQGWQIVRDLANIAFIFVLLVVAISQILGIAGWGAKQLLAKIIIAALLINFSLFFTKVLVDAGNLLGLAFYNSISVENNQQLSGYKDISVGIADKFQPQELFRSEVFKSLSDAGLGNPINNGASDSTAPVTSLSGNELASFFSLITALAAAVNIVMIGVFFSAGILMIARVIGIWIAMILSPLAFISYAIPGGTKWGKIGFSSWIKELGRLVVMAPMFLFFLYLIIAFVNADPIRAAFEANEQSNNLLLKLMSIIVPFILIVVLLRYAKKLTKEFSGEIGAALLKGANTVVGAAVGVAGGLALGGAAVAGRAVIGKAASNLSSGSFKNMANSDSKLTRALGRRLQGVADKTSKASFDVRQTSVGKKLSDKVETGFGAVGFNNQAVNVVGLRAREGGYDADQERRQKLRETQAERMMMTGDEATLHDKGMADRNDQFKKDESDLRTQITDALENNEAFQNLPKSEKESRIESAMNQFKETYVRSGNLLELREVDANGNINLRTAVERDQNGDAIIDPTTNQEQTINRGSGDVRMSGEINNDRKKKFAQELRQGAGASFAGINNAVRKEFGADYEGKPGDTNPQVSLGSIQAAQGLEKSAKSFDKTMSRFDETIDKLNKEKAVIKERIETQNTTKETIFSEEIENQNNPINSAQDISAQDIQDKISESNRNLSNIEAAITRLRRLAENGDDGARQELTTAFFDKRQEEDKIKKLNSLQLNDQRIKTDMSRVERQISDTEQRRRTEIGNIDKK